MPARGNTAATSQSSGSAGTGHMMAVGLSQKGKPSETARATNVSTTQAQVHSLTDNDHFGLSGLRMHNRKLLYT